MTRPFHTISQERWPKIIWDGLGLSAPRTGVAIHARNLYAEIKRSGVSPLVTMAGTDLATFVDEADRLLIPALTARLARLKPVYSNISYARAAEVKGPVIYHGLSNFNVPQFIPTRAQDRFVLTVHDIIPLLTGMKTPLSLQMAILMPKALERADKVIAISEWTRKTILDKFGQDLSSKIETIGNGFENIEAAASAQDRPLDFLTVSRWERYKRLDLIRDIAREMKFTKFHVVTDERGARALARAPKNVTITTKVNDRELRGLYTAAKCLLHPSSLEGWCLPASEALTAGTRVLYQSGSGIDEVCAPFTGRAIGLPSGSSIADWVLAATEILERSTQPASPGPLNLRTWAEAARRTLNIYENLVQ